MRPSMFADALKVFQRALVFNSARHVSARPPQLQMICWTCQKFAGGAHLFCARCRSIIYCSKQCQRADEARHTKHCDPRGQPIGIVDEVEHIRAALLRDPWLELLLGALAYEFLARGWIPMLLVEQQQPTAARHLSFFKIGVGTVVQPLKPPVSDERLAEIVKLRFGATCCGYADVLPLLVQTTHGYSISQLCYTPWHAQTQLHPAVVFACGALQVCAQDWPRGVNQQLLHVDVEHRGFEMCAAKRLRLFLRNESPKYQVTFVGVLLHSKFQRLTTPTVFCTNCMRRCDVSYLCKNCRSDLFCSEGCRWNHAVSAGSNNCRERRAGGSFDAAVRFARAVGGKPSFVADIAHRLVRRAAELQRAVLAEYYDDEIVIMQVSERRPPNVDPLYTPSTAVVPRPGDKMRVRRANAMFAVRAGNNMSFVCAELPDCSAVPEPKPHRDALVPVTIRTLIAEHLDKLLAAPLYFVVDTTTDVASVVGPPAAAVLLGGKPQGCVPLLLGEVCVALRTLPRLKFPLVAAVVENNKSKNNKK